jgi:predicted signal transduction protein with EAL and GGDEF domain
LVVLTAISVSSALQLGGGLLDEINQILLQLYETAQSASISEFPEIIFPLIKDRVKFDSGGFCDFNQYPQSGLKLVSAVAHNVSVEDKLRARIEYLTYEKFDNRNSLATDDPALAQAFRQKGRSVSLGVLGNDRLKPNVAAYGIKTSSLQTLTMVGNTTDRKSFQTISLWRSKANLSTRRPMKQ